MLDVVWLPTEHLGISENSFRKCPCITASNLNLEMFGFEPGELLQELLGGVCGTIPNTIGYFWPNQKIQALFFIGTLDQNLVWDLPYDRIPS